MNKTESDYSMDQVNCCREWHNSIRLQYFMKNFNIKQISFFLLRSVIAGLAIAFVLVYFLPEYLPSRGRDDFNMQNTKLASSDHGAASYHGAVAASAPAVVNVYATKVIRRRTHPILQDPIFRRFFGDQGSGEQRNSNLGSGVILNHGGYLITNAHVIREADEILITLADGRQARADVVGVDADTDLAVLKIDLEDLPSIPLGDSGSLNVGDVVLAIGNPYDFGQTVTQGIISATGRSRLGITAYVDFIQTDADINPGNSGGALINARGELIGINTVIISNTGGSVGIGLAIPVNTALNVMEGLIKQGYVVRGWLGIEAQVLPPGLVNEAGQKQPGILVAGVLKGGPADIAGIMPGDILVSINNLQLTTPVQVIQMISQFKPESTIELEVLRGWEKLAINATVSQRPTFQ